MTIVLRVVDVNKDGTETILAEFPSGAIAPPVDPPEDAPIIAVVTSKPTLTVRSSPKVSNSNPDNRVGVFQTGEQIWVSTETYATDGDDWIWRKVIKVNGASDPRVGKYVAEKKRDGTSPLLDLDEKTEIPPKVPPPNRGGIWGITELLVGSQVVPTFTKENKVHPIFMANKRTLAYEGKNISPFEYSTTHFRDFTLDRLKAAGINSIRFYAPLLGYNDQWMIDRIKEALDVLEGRFTAFITLMDCVHGGGDSPHRFAEDEPYYRNGYITPEYFTGKHYERRMLPFATKLVKALKDRDVWAYGVANEMSTQYQGNATDEQQAAGIKFLHTVADMIHAESTSLVTPGLLNISHIHNGNGTIKQLWDRVYDGRFDFAGFNMYEKEGQQPGDDWENEALALEDLKYSRIDRIPLLNTEAWRDNRNPHGTEAIKQKWLKWGQGYQVELSGWAVDFGEDRNVTDRVNGWSAVFDPQWESSLAFIADVYYPLRKQAYGVDW